jgi:hypothetical protein
MVTEVAAAAHPMYITVTVKSSFVARESTLNAGYTGGGGARGWVVVAIHPAINKLILLVTGAGIIYIGGARNE